jgi:hypothetical protein
MRRAIANRFFLSLLLLVPSISAYAYADIGDKPAVAVAAFVGEGLLPAQLEALRSNFEYELVRTGVYTVLERERIEEIIEEQSYQLSGAVGDSYIIEIGKQLGA